MIKIRPFVKSDFPSVKDIYQQGIDSGDATFQEQAKDYDDWNESLLPNCRLVAENNGQAIGWAALSSASNRCVYSGIAEVSVYVSSNSQGSGVGNSLLDALIKASEEEGIWTLQAGIFPENKVSIHIHSKHGFKMLGIREKLGQMNGIWRDIVFMERRSKVVGL
ncbi:MAG: N-acetyltransferase family protein [Gammaproteobacteria bacterium]